MRRLGLLAVAACGSSSAAPPAPVLAPAPASAAPAPPDAAALPTAKGRDFTIAIPHGWDVRDAAATFPNLPTGTILLAEHDTLDADALQGSILISPTPTREGRPMAETPESCRAVADNIASGSNATVRDAQLVDVPVAGACRFDLDGTNKHGAYRLRSMEILDAHNAWSAMCTYDPRDTAAFDACNQLLASWRFTS